MTITLTLPKPAMPEAPISAPTRVQFVNTITDFCLDLIQRCDGHAFVKESPALDILAIYAYGAVHLLATRHQLSAADRHMLGAKLFLEFFGQDSALALANAYALAGAASHAANFRNWQCDPTLLDADDFRAHLLWPEAA